MSYSYKTDDLVLVAPGCLPLWSFRICHHLLEGIKFQASSSRSPSSSFVTVAFHFSNSWQFPNFTSSRANFTFALCASHLLSVLPLLCSPFPLSLSLFLSLLPTQELGWPAISQSMGSSDSLVLTSCLKAAFVNLFDPWGKSDGAGESNSSPNPSPLTASKYLSWPLQVLFSFLLLLQAFFCSSLSWVLGAGGEGDDRGWDGWMASPTRWTWVRVNSGSWWWTGRPGVLQFMGSQRVGQDWASELTGTEVECFEVEK